MVYYPVIILSIVNLASSRESIPSYFTLGTFYPVNQYRHDPRKSETLSSGAIRDVIKRHSPRYRKVLIRNSNRDVYFTTEDSHYMTSRTKSKLDVLASLFRDRYYVGVKVLKAWSDNVIKTDMLSLHYEGRALQVQSSDGRRDRLSDLAKLAIEAGFDWVHYVNRDYIHISVLPDVCQTKLDIAIVVDSSGSIGSYNFRIMKGFLKKLVDFFNIGRDETHVALISYSYQVEIEFYLNQYFDKNQVKSGIDKMWYQASNTKTGDALVAMAKQVFRTWNGMRADPSIPKLGILMTDGYSNGGTSIWSASNIVKNAGINMFVIGMTSAPRMSEIRLIASKPLNSHFLRIQEFTDLSHFVDRISMVSCDQGAQMSKCATTETDVEGGSFKYFRIELPLNVQKITIELTDHKGMSFMYVSTTLTNPGPLSDSKDVQKIESAVSPRTLTLKMTPTGKPAIIYIAVQGQKDDNKFGLSLWESLFPKDSDTLSVYENGKSQQYLTTVRTKTYPQGFYYRIKEGNAQGMFTLDQSSGALYTRSLDREKVDSYQLSIIAQDKQQECHKGLFILHINVLDRDDNVPVFQRKEYEAKVRENTPSGQYVTQVKASDADIGTNAEVRYYIDGPSKIKDVFKIDPKTGIVTTSRPLDYEATSKYSLKLSVEDIGPLKTRGYSYLNIYIIDVNEPPYFTSPSCIRDSSCKFQMPEEKPTGTAVGNVIRASDPDKVPCALTFDIVSQDQAYFTIGKTSGVITTRKRLDREVKENYVIGIQVADCGNPKLTEKRSVHIKLDDINDNSPKFQYSSYTVRVYEDMKVRSDLPLKIRATDADAGTNAKISYSLSQKESPGYFQIDSTTAKLTLVKALDREKQAKIVLTALAHDGGNPPRTTPVTVTVIVLDVNDNAPQFVGPPIFEIVENVKPGGFVGVVKATDADEGLNGRVHFSMLHGDPMFQIDITGKLHNTGVPDREKIDKYTLTIKASDLGSTPLSSTKVYTVKVLDVNDNTPVCQNQVKTVKQDIPIGTTIAQIRASDPDLGENGTFTFNIDGGGDDKFNINARTGMIQLKNALHFYQKSFYQLKIRVPDNGKEQLVGHCHVDITVKDTNLHTPTFSRHEYTKSVEENIPIKTKVMTLTAVDGDSGTSGEVVYSITKQVPASHFSISSKTGEIVTSHTIDYEIYTKYTLTVIASDKGKPPKSSVTIVKLSIVDLNDNAPVMKTFRTSIPEDISVGKQIGLVTATDKDSGSNGEVSFKSSSHGFPFTVQADGKVTVSHPLDRELVDFYNLQITASDNGSPSLSTSGLNPIYITDVNDNHPIFTESHYQCTVVENSVANTYVCSVKATDRDIEENARIAYTIHINKFFNIHPVSGQVSVHQPIDREVTPHVDLIVTATDHGMPSLNGNASLHVKVIDVNDNTPHCSKSSYSFTFVEEQPSGAVVGQIAATDKDEGSNADVSFKLVDGHIFNSKPKFFLTSGSNHATLKGYRLDYEEHSHYRITVGLTDNGKPALSSQCLIDVQLVDINDNSPVLSQKKFERSIKETVGIGTYILQVIATDKDSGKNGQLSYKIISGNEHRHFQLSETTGVLTTAKVLDYDTIKNYTFIVDISDNGKPRKNVRGMVIVHIIAVDRTPPRFEKVQNVSVYEDVAIGRSIMQFKATGEGGRKLTFDIVGGNEEDKFSIHNKTGLMSLKHSLDRETTDFYNITVSAFDRRKTRKQSLPVYVLDINDNAPVFNKSSYSAEFPENKIGDIIKISATDADIGSNAEIEFSITSGDTYGEFLIDKESGVIKAKKGLDREAIYKYVLTIEAADKGKPVLKSYVRVVVLVQDVNDNSPIFDHSSYTISIAENTGTSYPVISVLASDIDAGNNGTVGYRIKQGDSKVFHINSETGVILTKQNLDRETRDRYELIIEAHDFGTPDQLAKTASVKITVLDINDNHPEIISPKALKPCNESAPVGTKLDIIKAVDKDAGSNAELVYSISNEGKEQKFRIDPGSGQVFLNGMLDAEKQQSYVVITTVTDQGSPSLSNATKYELHVLDDNDNPPIFIVNSYRDSIEENKQGKTYLFTANATDADITTINSNIIYSLVTDDTSGLFEVEPRSGAVSVTRPLDYEKVRSYKFNIKAADWKFSAQVPVEVDVININDNNPIFTSKTYVKTIPENSKNGYHVLSVNATDLDPFGDLHYSLISPNESCPFTIDDKTGLITANGELDRETTPWFVFDVYATDNGVPVLNGSAHVNITLSDVNDNPPLFEFYSKTVKIQENQDAGSYLITVVATDKDIGSNAEVKYYPTKRDGNFHIDAKTGRITTKRSFDRELTPSLEFRFFARDGGTPALESEEFVLKVIIGDENDNTPSWLPEYYTVDLPEDTDIGFKFIDVSASDPDLGENGTIIYEIINHEVSPFEIESGSGVVSVRLELDREKVDFYNVTMVARDNGTVSRSSTCHLYINVTDVNDNAPKIDPATLTGEVYENKPKGTEVVKVKATDLDIGMNAKLVFEIKGPWSDLFHIDNSTGLVVTMMPLDREEKDRYSLQLTVSDHGEPRLSMTTLINITILDLDDNCPIFERSFYTSSIKENSPYGTLVTKVAATDADIGEHAILNYGVLSSDDRGVFNVNPDTGEVRVGSGDVDREYKEVYHLKVRAGTPYCGQTRNGSEGEKPLKPNYAFTNVYITLQDENDNAPEFHGEENIIFNNVTERELYQLNATDPDLGAGGEVEFRLKNSYEKINGEYVENHVIVEAFDHGEVSLVSNETLIVVNHVRCDAMQFFVSSTGLVTVESLCSVNNAKRDLKMLVGEFTHLACVARGNMQTKYRWIKDGHSASGGWSKNGNYVLNNVTKEAEGYYACIASNDAGSIQSSSTELIVREKPKVIEEQGSLMVDLGGDAVLKVVSTGDPAPAYQWYKNKRRIREYSNPTAKRSQLVLNNTITDDTGVYKCKITNEVGEIWSRDVNIDIVDRADVVSVQVKVNRPDHHGRCQKFSAQEFQKAATHILKEDVIITDVTPDLSRVRFCNVTTCSNNPCQNDGKCSVVEGGYQCQCLSTWTGTNCEKDTNECEASVDICYGNNSKCHNLDGSFSCDCSHGRTGHRCEYRQDACNANKCSPTQELCVPLESGGTESYASERQYACVNKHNVIRLVFNSSAGYWTTQKKFEIVDRLNQIVKSQSTFMVNSYVNSFDFGVCTFHIIDNATAHAHSKSSSKIDLVLDCSDHQTSVNLTSRMISSLCTLISPSDKTLTECGEPKSTWKPLLPKLDHAEAKIHLIMKYKDSTLSADESMERLHEHNLNGAVEGVTVSGYQHAYEHGKRKGGKGGSGSENTTIIVVVCVILSVVVIAGIAWFVRKPGQSIIPGRRNKYRPGDKPTDLINPAYDGASMDTDDGGVVNFQYDMVKEDIDWDKVDKGKK